MFGKSSRSMTVRNRYSLQTVPSNYPDQNGDNWLEHTNTDNDRRGGLIGVNILLIALILMGSLITMESAALSKGTVKVEGSYKSVQHLEGGIVREIMVEEGDTVQKGDPLVLLNNLQFSKQYESTDLEVSLAMAKKNRWQAVQEWSKTIDYDQVLIQSNSEEVQTMLAQQTRLFNTDLALFITDRSVLQGKKKNAQQRRNNERRRYAKIKGQSDAIEAELNDYQELRDQGLVTRSVLFDIEQKRSEILLRKDELESAIDQTTKEIEQVDFELNSLSTNRISEASKQLEQIEDQLRTLQRNADVLKDQVDRSIVRAPVSGNVFNMSIFTVGGIVQPGEQLMDIVPNSGKMVVEAEVEAINRDTIKVGQRAEIKFLAYNQVKKKPYKGVVTSISAAGQSGQGASAPYFSTIVELDEDISQTTIEGLQVYPGMLAEVMIITGERTPIEYILSPISDSFNRALREQ